MLLSNKFFLLLFFFQIVYSRSLLELPGVSAFSESKTLFQVDSSAVGIHSNISKLYRDKGIKKERISHKAFYLNDSWGFQLQSSENLFDKKQDTTWAFQLQQQTQSGALWKMFQMGDQFSGKLALHFPLGIGISTKWNHAKLIVETGYEQIQQSGSGLVWEKQFEDRTPIDWTNHSIFHEYKLNSTYALNPHFSVLLGIKSFEELPSFPKTGYHLSDSLTGTELHSGISANFGPWQFSTSYSKQGGKRFLQGIRHSDDSDKRFLYLPIHFSQNAIELEILNVNDQSQHEFQTEFRWGHLSSTANENAIRLKQESLSYNRLFPPDIWVLLGNSYLRMGELLNGTVENWFSDIHWKSRWKHSYGTFLILAELKHYEALAFLEFNSIQSSLLEQDLQTLYLEWNPSIWMTRLHWVQSHPLPWWEIEIQFGISQWIPIQFSNLEFHAPTTSVNEPPIEHEGPTPDFPEEDEIKKPFQWNGYEFQFGITKNF